jgi:hypothetical protein
MIRVFKKHKTQNRFWDYTRKIWVEGFQIKSAGASRGPYRPDVLVLDHAGRDITKGLFK